MKSRITLLLPLVIVLLFSGTAVAAVTVTRTSSPDLYIDNDISPEPVGMYAAYRIVSTSDIADAWVRIENFGGGSIGLAAYETGVVHLGPMSAGVPRMAYFYLQGTETATPQTHDVNIYDRLPTAPSASLLGSSSWTLGTVSDTVQANSNQVTALVSGPTPPTLGGIVTITVSGKTGVIGGSNGPLVFTPAAFADWPADAYQLYASSITFSGGNTGTYNDTLYFAGLASPDTTDYVAVYSFRAMSVTAAPAAVSPVTYISGGATMKHTFLDSDYYTLAALSPIQPATNTLTMSKSVNLTTLPNTGGTVTYTLRVTNNSAAYSANLDSIKDTLPASASYVAGSSTFNGLTINDSVASGADLTWYRLFVIPPSSFRDLVFQATLPGTSGTHTNSAVGYIGQSTVIDTTITTADNTPATASTIVLAPPAISKGFTPNSIAPGGTSSLTFTITNPNSATAISGVAFTDTLPVSPAAMTLSSPSTTNTCGGTLTDTGGNPLVAGSAGVKLTGGGIAAGGSCGITVQVTAGAGGTYSNTTGAVSSTTAGAGSTANASLVVSDKPSITKSFAPASIASGGTSVLTLTIINNMATPLTGVTFIDTYSANIVNFATPNGATTCTGGTVTAAAGGGSIALSGGTIPAGGSCAVTVTVTSSTAGSHPNTSGGVTANEPVPFGPGADSNTAYLTVLSPPTISKAFSPATVAINSPSTLTVTITNPNSGGALTGVGFNDIFPTSPAAMTLASATTTNTCGGALTDNADDPLAVGSAGIKLSGGSIAAGGSCSVTVSVQAPVTGTYSNTTGNVTSTEGGSGNIASENLLVDLQPTFTKSFGTNPAIARGSSVITFTITNNSMTTTLTNISFTDVFPTFPGQMSLDSVPAPADNTCGGDLRDSANNLLAIGSTSIKLSGATTPIAPGGNCTIKATVKTLVGGLFTNTTTTLTSSGPTANAASATLNVYTLSKQFSPNPILPTGTTTLRLTVTNPDTANAISGVGFTDIFPTAPAQMSLSSASYTNTCGGTVTDNANNPLTVGSTSVKLAGGSVGPNTDCTVLVTVKLNTATTGTYVNTAGIDSTDNLVLTLTPTATKSFTPSTIAVNGTSTMSIVLTNNTGLGALTGVSFTDTFPAGLVVAAAPNLTNTCGGTITGGTAGESYLNLSGGAIAAGAASACTITLDVTSATGGTYNNAASGVSSVQTGAPGQVSNTATLLVQMPAPGVAKTFDPASAALNVPARMTVAFTNPNASSITGVSFTDLYPAGLVNIASGAVVESNTCGGLISAVNSGTSLTFSGGVIPPAGCALTVNVAGASLGDKTNSTGPVTSANAVTHAGASATLSVVNNASLSKEFIPPVIGIGQTSSLVFTITNGSGDPAQSGLGFVDVLPAGVTMTGPPASPQCGGAVTYPSPDRISVTGAALGSGTANCVITAVVTAAAEGSYVNDSGTVSALAGGLLADGLSATLTVQKLPSLTVVKLVQIQADPVSAANPKAIPGAYLLYTITTVNSGLGAASAVVIEDPVPANADLFVGDLGVPGSGPVAFIDGPVASGLSLGAIDYSNTLLPPYTYGYSPAPDANGFDPFVRSVRIRMNNSMAASDGTNHPSFSLRFRVRVK